MRSLHTLLIGLVVVTMACNIPDSSDAPVVYEISFENAVHHEAEVKITFPEVGREVLEVRMSRTSPGRYAIHNFAKNVYNVRAHDGAGNELEITRPTPEQWNISGHDGTVVFEYTLFANRGGGTYSQVDETHAHLNIPATFAFARLYTHRPVEITFDVRDDLNWKVATQLPHKEGNTYTAPDNYYFMDSPTEIADFHLREEEVDGQNIRMALLTPATDAEVDEYFAKVMAIVKAQRDVFGELPTFDYGEYTFISTYIPNASGDGMEHRNSTIVSNSKPLDRPLGETSMGTMSHEFFHAWNVERIRPASLEPFDFEDANISGELWFAEGFTSYYTNLMIARAGVRPEEQYFNSLGSAVGFVINAPGRRFHSPIEMSYRATFVDAATSIDPTNNNNIFISYYTYGNVLGLALDMSLRSMDTGLNLDDYMKLVWQKYGKQELPYTILDLENTLVEYAGAEFANEFFASYIYDSQMPDYEQLFKNMGLNFEQVSPDLASLGGNVINQNGRFRLTANALIGSPVYNAGIEREDVFISIDGRTLRSNEDVSVALTDRKPGDTVEVVIERWGERMTKQVTLSSPSGYRTRVNENATAEEVARRNAWVRGSE